MNPTLRTLQWNIRNGLIRNENADPLADESYQIDNLDYIVEQIALYNPDIITLQETHANQQTIQAQTIAEKLGGYHWINDIYDKSYLREGYGLGQAILSRTPLTDHSFHLFHNPRYQITRPNGDKWISHDKGMTTCHTTISGLPLVMQTMHAIPFHLFTDVLGETNRPVLEDINSRINQTAPHMLLQADFNCTQPKLNILFPATSQNGTAEMPSDKPTTPRGKYADRIIYRGLKPQSLQIPETLTDHYPLITDFTFL